MQQLSLLFPEAVEFHLEAKRSASVTLSDAVIYSGANTDPCL